MGGSFYVEALTDALVRESAKIIAINTDGDADMFTRANYGVVGDYKEVLPGFVARAKEIRG